MADFSGTARYATRGVADKVGLDLQVILWGLIDERKASGASLDYIQTFELSMEFALGNIYQKIIHRQEVPPFSQTVYYATIERPIKTKIWAIDDGSYATMLLPNEY